MTGCFTLHAPLPLQQPTLKTIKCYLFGGLLLLFILAAIRPGLLGNWFSPLLSFVAALLPFLLVGRLKPEAFKSETEKSTQLIPITNPLHWTAMALFLFAYALVGAGYMLDAAKSDVIPTIQLFVARFLSGAVPYDTITEFGYYLAPTYLPMHWMPFVASEWIGLDARVWSGILFFIFALICLRPLQQISSMRTQRLLAYAPVFFAALLLLFQRDDMGYSVELLLAGYYLLFCRSLMRLNPWLAAVSLVLILLSRFSLVLWLPLALVVLWQRMGYRFVLKAAVPVIAGILLLYVWPFLSERPDSFKNAQDYYAMAAEKEWAGQSWQKPGDNPFQISRGLGFAWWFYQGLPGTLVQKISVVRLVHLVVSLSAVALLLWAYFRKYRLNMPLPLFLSGSLHLYLWVFTLFIQVPYPYLFFIPLAVSSVWTLQVWLSLRETGV